MSDGEILQAAPYHHLLASSIEFQDLVHAHKKTAGSDRPADATAAQGRGTFTRDIRKAYVEKHKKGSKGDQLIKQEEREIGDMGFKPYLKYLNQNKGFLYFSIASLSHLIFVASQISQNSWMAANVENPNVSTLRLIVVYLLIAFSATLVLLCRSLASVALGLQSSKSLFSQLLNSLFRAPMSFYDSTPLGRILSRVCISNRKCIQRLTGNTETNIALYHFVLVQVSSDLSIIDLDVPFSLIYAVVASINAYASLGVLAVVTWQVLFVSIPMVYLAIRLQVTPYTCHSFGMLTGEISLHLTQCKLKLNFFNCFELGIVQS
jgi:ATP-binding cassette subfamily C (CFTR/MRP) protein 2